MGPYEFFGNEKNEEDRMMPVIRHSRRHTFVSKGAGHHHCGLCGYGERDRLHQPAMLADSFGYSLAMRVLQSTLYANLDDKERAECDELIRRGQ